jgi:hypothetical protein
MPGTPSRTQTPHGIRRRSERCPTSPRVPNACHVKRHPANLPSPVDDVRREKLDLLGEATDFQAAPRGLASERERTRIPPRISATLAQRRADALPGVGTREQAAPHPLRHVRGGVPVSGRRVQNSGATSTACRVLGRTLDLIANSGQMRPKPGPVAVRTWLSKTRHDSRRRGELIKNPRRRAGFLVAGERFEPSTSGL